MKTNTHNVTFRAGTATVQTPIKGVSATYKINGVPVTEAEYFKKLFPNPKKKS